MGHEVATTTMQLARACAVVANGGLLIRPRIILKKNDQPLPAEAPQRVLRPETAITMRQMMEGVVVHPSGTGHKARLNGYSSGGKTGSAVIYDYATKHYTHSYNGSFIGFSPVPNPAIVIAVTVNGTHGTAGYGGQAAAPVFKVVAEEALRVLDVPKDLPELTPDDKKKEPEPDNTDDLAIAGLSDPPPLDEEEDKATAVASAPVEAGPKVPNFQGQSMRAVLAQASAMGLPVLAEGSGDARGQQPAPGAVLHTGERIRVRFAR
jgi:cell division protein FtsI (penicillin-binding protein 3)